ncbi:MAG: sulfatase-like hydrolase/transferase, partial [Planctomycetales bacterium]|nr:sulfatase-like hydrolase/transferase [Planctomycetales bacterium]
VDTLPTRRGFERFFGVIWGVVNHFDPFSLCEGETPVASTPEDFYLTHAIGDHAVDWVREFASDEAPFFLYVAYTAPHWPIHAPPASIAKYQGVYEAGWDRLRETRFQRQCEIGLFDQGIRLGPVDHKGQAWRRLTDDRKKFQSAKMAVHAAMVDEVDQSVGKIVDALAETGQLDNTLILVMSDNGASPEIPGGPGYDRYGATREGAPALRDADLQQPQNWEKIGSEESFAGIGAAWASSVNTPLRYWKMESYDGGCRTPLVVHWPHGLQGDAGRVATLPSHVIDLAPTFYSVARVDSQNDALDGVDLSPILDGRDLTLDRRLYFAHGDGRGVRDGKWKASKRAKHGWELFDIEADPGETTDISGHHPDVLNRLVGELHRWRDAAHGKR